MLHSCVCMCMFRGVSRLQTAATGKSRSTLSCILKCVTLCLMRQRLIGLRGIEEWRVNDGLEGDLVCVCKLVLCARVCVYEGLGYRKRTARWHLWMPPCQSQLATCRNAAIRESYLSPLSFSFHYFISLILMRMSKHLTQDIYIGLNPDWFIMTKLWHSVGLNCSFVCLIVKLYVFDHNSTKAATKVK